MPKDRRERSISFDRCNAAPYACSSRRTRRSSSVAPQENQENIKEWEDARCPVCMEHPHNAVLLICSSHEKGCRPYMCDTSYRHSNCLDQFRKSFAATPSESPLQEESSVPMTASPIDVSSVPTVGNLEAEQIEERPISSGVAPCEDKVQPQLVCPLCRGNIKDWIVMEPARRFMNAKSRSCACETCEFTGTYADLRKHARLEHPLVRPSDVDPERQRSWRRMEHQRDIGDLLSTLQSSLAEERGEDGILPNMDEGGWLTVFFLIRVFRPGSSSRSSGGGWYGASRARAQLSVRRRNSQHWGEAHDGETGSSSRDEDDDSSDGGSGPWRRSDRTQPRTPDRS